MEEYWTLGEMLTELGKRLFGFFIWAVLFYLNSVYAVRIMDKVIHYTMDTRIYGLMYLLVLIDLFFLSLGAVVKYTVQNCGNFIHACLFLISSAIPFLICFGVIMWILAKLFERFSIIGVIVYCLFIPVMGILALSSFVCVIRLFMGVIIHWLVQINDRLKRFVIYCRDRKARRELKKTAKIKAKIVCAKPGETVSLETVSDIKVFIPTIRNKPEIGIRVSFMDEKDVCVTTLPSGREFLKYVDKNGRLAGKKIISDLGAYLKS